MIYKFKSQATPDLIMMGPHGDHFLELIGKTPSPQGIIEVAQLPAAIEALKAAVAADEAEADPSASAAETGGEAEDTDEAAAVRSERVSLRQRMWPMVTMMTHALAEKQNIVWGV